MSNTAGLLEHQRILFTRSMASSRRSRSGYRAGRPSVGGPAPEPGGSGMLLLEWLRNAVPPPGSRTHGFDFGTVEGLEAPGESRAVHHAPGDHARIRDLHRPATNPNRINPMDG